jgi:putative hydrolase of the HAD superfamily
MDGLKFERHRAVKFEANRIPFRAVLFDLDDTLYPERDYVSSGFRAIGEWAEERLGLSQVLVRAELQSLFDAGFRRDAFQWWLADKGFPEGLLAEMTRIFRAHTPRISLRPEAILLLDSLKAASLRLGLVTEGRRAVQDAKISALGLDRWMQAMVVLGEEDTENWKPSTVPFERALAMLSIAPADSVYIGDNPQKDFRGARALGMRAIRIRYPDGAHAEEEPAEPEDAPDQELKDLSGLYGLLQVG